MLLAMADTARSYHDADKGKDEASEPADGGSETLFGPGTEGAPGFAREDPAPHEDQLRRDAAQESLEG